MTSTLTPDQRSTLQLALDRRPTAPRTFMHHAQMFGRALRPAPQPYQTVEEFMDW